LLACVASIGCSQGEPTYLVSGKVSYEGRPVTSGAINFFPSRGKPLGGGIRADGTYQFELPAGEYRVAINAPPPIPESWKEGDPFPHTEAPIPARFARPDSSGLTLTVSASDAPQTRDFELP
jgi:hypothetical protein